VTKLLFDDQTIKEFSFQGSDSDFQSKCKIEMIQRVINCESLIADEKFIEILDYLSDDLGNGEMKAFVLKFVDRPKRFTNQIGWYD
jgi:hypothetical protein